jgi:IS5 family transposase
VDAAGIPPGTVAAPVNRHDASLLEPALDALVVTDTTMTVNLDRGYDSDVTRTLLAPRRIGTEIARRGCPAPITAEPRCVVERPTTCTEIDSGPETAYATAVTVESEAEVR